MMTPETDTELISQARSGDRFAVERLIERHRRSVYAVAYRALRNADDAQDVAQEALIYACGRIGDARDPERFAAWLRRVTLSLCADYRRRRRTRPLGEPIAAWNEASEETDFAERLILRQALERLSEDHRTTLLLHYVGGWSLAEVAELLEIPLNTARSRLMSAKRRLRADLRIDPMKGSTMPEASETITLNEIQKSLIRAAFPKARILSSQDTEPWMPFSPRVRLALEDGSEKTVDFRGDIDPDRAALLPVLERLGLPVPRLIHGPIPDRGRRREIARTPHGRVDEATYLCLCEVPRGENLHLWAMGGTPHRIRLATDRAFEAADRLRSVTDALLDDPIGARLPRRTLLDEIVAIEDAGGDWLADPWFAATLDAARKAAIEIETPLAYTDYLFFHPNFDRIQPGDAPFDEPLGWPGDSRLSMNPLVEIVSPFGYIGDPYLGLAMIWIYDCYPFVHMGFVERYLWKEDVSMREFGPRLAIKALQILQRELPVARPDEGASYWDAVRGYAEQGLSWL